MSTPAGQKYNEPPYPDLELSHPEWYGPSVPTFGPGEPENLTVAGRRTTPQYGHVQCSCGEWLKPYVIDDEAVTINSVNPINYAGEHAHGHLEIYWAAHWPDAHRILSRGDPDHDIRRGYPNGAHPYKQGTCSVTLTRTEEYHEAAIGG